MNTPVESPEDKFFRHMGAIMKTFLDLLLIGMVVNGLNSLYFDSYFEIFSQAHRTLVTHPYTGVQFHPASGLYGGVVAVVAYVLLGFTQKCTEWFGRYSEKVEKDKLARQAERRLEQVETNG